MAALDVWTVTSWDVWE